MANLPYNIFASIPLPFLSLITLFVIYSIIKRRRFLGNPKNLPPSPPKLPFIGNLHQLGSHPHESLGSLSRKHGPLMIVHLGEVPYLIVSSSDMASSIMRTHDLVFASRPSSVIANIIGFIDIGFEPYNETWRQLRKIFTTHLLSSKMIKSHETIIVEEVDRMIQEIKNHADFTNKSPINMSDVLSSFMTCMISRVVCGEFAREEGMIEILKKWVEDRNNLLSQFSIGDLFPTFSWMERFIGLSRRAKRNRERWEELLGAMIKSHEQRKDNREGELVDLVDVLLSMKNDPSMTFGINMDHIKGLTADAFAAGVDTTYITLDWAMSELMRNPQLMNKLRDEIRGIVKYDTKVRLEDLNEMNYLKAVIKETLRLHPPIPILLPRQSMEQCDINGFTIPKGTRVLVNAWAIAREPKSWEAPEEFMPERFIGSTVDYKGNDFQFIPFGAGRRMCPGIQFSMTIAPLALANLVHQYDWEFPSGVTSNTFDMSNSDGLAVRRKDDLRLVVKPSV